MKRSLPQTCDFLVIGSGLAGLMTALKLESAGRVLLVTKGRLEDGATEYAQGGIAAVTHPDDSLESHAADTLRAGGGLCREEAVRTVVAEAPARLRELIELGVRFSLREKSGDEPETFALGLEGGHSHRRILHVADRTGRPATAWRWRSAPAWRSATWNSSSSIRRASIIPTPSPSSSARRCGGKAASSSSARASSSCGATASRRTSRRATSWRARSTA